MTHKKHLISEFLRDEDGGATGWNLAWFAVLAAGSGFAIDVSNARNAKEHLTVTAEAASHAGLVALMNTGSTGDARAAAIASVQQNYPSDVFGPVIADSTSDIVVANYNAEESSWSDSGMANAVGVTLRRDESTKNGVSTFLLNWVGLEEWTFSASAATAMAGTQRCSNTEGLFAQGNIQLRSHNGFGTGICLHSDEYVTMSNHNVFDDGAYVSMPDLSLCEKCDDDDKNPGIVDAAYETKYIMPDIADWIEQTELSFMGSGDSAIKDAFFEGRALDRDLSSLSELDYDTRYLERGSVVEISATEFYLMEDVPEGLTYNVSCAVSATSTGTSNGNGRGKSNGNGNGNGKNKSSSDVTSVSSLDFSNAPLKDLAVITDCPVDFSSEADLLGVMIVTSSDSGISGSSGTTIGASNYSCDPLDRVTIMTNADVHMAAKFLATNLTLVIDGAIHLASGGSGNSDHYGVGIHTSGDIDVTTHHNYYSCGNSNTEVAPVMGVIRHVSAD
ncbi:hypothetical protein [Neptunicoccus cionae]|uniref:DUF7867 domain-containing protein n=1 Tax=Neptunicoccus cionae TaxID=2035344 RepID=A0A916R009_9RHOB|nr:hypothetical protein [Amylibacter cionae]GGA24659.1 hypothetical protein GCM10011498_27100 [Amylibacter cionae]